MSVVGGEDEQGVVVDKLRTAENVVQETARALAKLRLLKKGLLSDLVSGRRRTENVKHAGSLPS